MFRFFVWLFCLVVLLSGGLGCSQQPENGGKETAGGGTEDTLHFPVTIDYSQSYRDMVEAGKYDSADIYGSAGSADIAAAKNYRFEGTGIVKSEIVLVQFDHYLKPDEAIEKMEQMGLRPARLEELLALCAKYPDLQHKFRLVDLDVPSSVSPGSRVVFVADELSGKRRLRVYWSDRVWEDDSRFPAVRK